MWILYPYHYTTHLELTTHIVEIWTYTECSFLGKSPFWGNSLEENAQTCSKIWIECAPNIVILKKRMRILWWRGYGIHILMENYNSSKCIIPHHLQRLGYILPLCHHQLITKFLFTWNFCAIFLLKILIQ